MHIVLPKTGGYIRCCIMLCFAALSSFEVYHLMLDPYITFAKLSFVGPRILRMKKSNLYVYQKSRELLCAYMCGGIHFATSG